ncbi:MAG TPA: Gfo/Idh/MocA family oxidoreductase [Phycisphaerae bacterium]|nr:Gfo/Idh/MocA family oxidoreductase [Phycisphaerae bacterium]
MPGQPFGLVGLGVYAGYVGRFLLERLADDSKPLRLAAVYEPHYDQHPELTAAMSAKGVRLCTSYEELLQNVHSLWLPIPIDLHRSFTEQALAAGKPVLCEKPAAGCIQDIDAMIRARDAATLPVAIGYQDIYAESTQSLKQQLIDGAFGRIAAASLIAMWPRTTAYYLQRPWAGKLARNGVWILDSPANNALAHFLHLALYLLGPKRHESARPVSVDAELYRVNDIETYDTCCLRITIETGQQLLVCLSHASSEHLDPILTLDGAGGDRIVYDYGQKIATVRWGGFDVPMTLTPNTYEETLSGFEALLQNPAQPALPHASLEMSRMHGLVISGASQAAPVHTLDPAHFTEQKKDDGGDTTLRHIPRLPDLFRRCISMRRMLHELSAAPWTRPARHLDLRNYTTFTGPPPTDTSPQRPTDPSAML